MARESLGEAVLDLRADDSKYKRDLAGAESHTRGWMGKVQGFLSQAFSFATGGLIADGLRRIADGIASIGHTAIQAVSDAQTLEMGLRGLFTENLMYQQVAESHTRLVQTREADARALERLSLEQQVAANALADYNARLAETEEITASHLLKQMKLEDKLASITAELGEASGAQAEYVTTTRTSWKQVMAFADAQELARQETKRLLDFLDVLAVKSPFEAKQVEEVARLAVANRMATDEVEAFTQAFLNYSAVHGITSSNLAFAADQFLQLRKIGKLTTIDLRQLRRLGIDVERILGVKLGMTVEQFNSQVARSPELMDKLYQGFIEMAGESAEGAAEEMSKTLPGLMANAKDIITIGSRKLFRPIVEAVTPTLSLVVGKLADWVTSPRIVELGQTLGDALGMGIEGAVKLIEGDERGLYDIAGAVTKLFGWEAGAEFAQWAEGALEWINTLKDGIADFGDSETGQRIKGILDTFTDFASGAAPELLENVGEIVGTLGAALYEFARDELIPTALDGLEGFVNWLSENETLITQTADRWTEAILNVAGGLGKLLEVAWRVVDDAILPVVGEQLGGLAEAAMLASTGDIDAAGEAWRGSVENSVGLMQEPIERFFNWLMSGTFYEGFVNTLGPFFEQLETGTHPIQLFFTEKIPGWYTEFETWCANMASVVDPLGVLFTETIPGWFETFKTEASTRITDIEAKWRSSGQAWQTIADGIGRLFTVTLPGKIEDGKNAIQGKIEEFRKAGEDLLNGLRDGIEGAKDRIRNALSGVASLIPQWLKDFLGIGSPAKVMIPLGFSITEGVGEGMLAGMDWLKSFALPKLGDGFTDALIPVFQPPQFAPVMAGAGGGQTFSINFNEPVYLNNDMDVQTLTQRIVQEIWRHR